MPATVSLDDDLRKVASLMFSNDITWLPCVDEAGRVFGQITQRAMTHHLGSRFRPTESAATAEPATKE